jgi:hypothetical protein
VKTLYFLGAKNVIQNLTFLGGATDIMSKEDLYQEIFSETISGTIKNVHTDKDFILSLFNLSY